MQRYAGGLDQLLDFTLLRFLEVEVDFGAVLYGLRWVHNINTMRY